MPTRIYPVSAKPIGRRLKSIRQTTPLGNVARATTPVERFLLLATVVVLPLQDHIPSIAGFSIVYVIFLVLAGYVLMNRSQALQIALSHPLFVTAYVLLALAFVSESLRSESSYGEILRIVQMISGATCIASLCRDRMALRTCLYGYILAGAWMSVLLITTTYGALDATSARDFDEASEIRSEVLDSNPLRANLNEMAFVSAQGSIVALAFALTTSRSGQRKLFLALCFLMLVATFLPMSRGGILIVAISCAAILYASPGKNIRNLLIAVLVAAFAVYLVPSSVVARFDLSTTQEEDARARLYTAVVERLPDYGLTGVGVGHFWGTWGRYNGFGRDDNVWGAHNGLAQATIYWGVVGFLGLVAVIVRAYRCLPKSCGSNSLSLALLGLAVSLVLFLMVIHTLYAKDFTLGLGLLVAGHCWIWPSGVVQPRWKRKRVKTSAV
jgi:hypothetical protein